MTIIDEFDLNPSTDTLTATSQSIKNCIENSNFKKLKEHPECRPELTKLAKRIITFWDAASRSSNLLSEKDSITLIDVAKVSYGLEAFIKWDKDQEVFDKDDVKALLPAVRELMRKLMNKIDTGNLIAVNYHEDTGRLLALLAWVGIGIKKKVLDFSEDGSSPSIAQISNNVITCLLEAPATKFDTRQVCKMVYQLARMIRYGELSILNSEDTPQIDPSKLASQLVRLSNSSLLTNYTERHHTYSAEYVNPIAADNLCSGLHTFFLKGILAWGDNNHRGLAVKAAILIKKASMQPEADGQFVKRCRAFLNLVIQKVSKESSQPFNEALIALNELEKRLS
jgi:hypothetical protein